MTLQKKFFFTAILLFILALTGLSAIYFSQIFQLRTTLEQQILKLSTDYYAEKFLRFHKQYALLASSIDSMGNLDSLFDKSPLLRKIVRKNLIQDLQLLKDKYPLVQQIQISGAGYEQSFHYPEKDLWQDEISNQHDCAYQVSENETLTLFSTTGKQDRTIRFVINIGDILKNLMDQNHDISVVVGRGNCGLFVENGRETEILDAATMEALLHSERDETITFSETEYLVSRVNNEQHPIFVLEPLNASHQVTRKIFLFLSLFILFFSVLIMILTHMVSKRITGPIQKLASRVSQFHTGTFTPLTVNSKDEVGALSLAFNEMGVEIQAFTETLESKILERTEELEVANKKLAELSNKDALTKLHNRRFFNEKSLELYELAVRNRRVFCMSIIDIDYFKKLNDRYGHQTGDTCLRQLATIMRHNFQRSSDYIVRYGGEEFAIFTLEETGDNFATRLEALCQEVAESTICKTDTEEAVRMTISIGYSLLHPGETSTLHKIIAKADEALYLAKSNGRNRVEGINYSADLQ